MPQIRRPAAFFAAFLMLASVRPAAPDADTALHERRSVGLERAWHRPLGSGYSAVTVTDARALTMFSDGEDDVLASLDVETGEEQWRYRVGDRYPAVGGSYDGPLSTPITDGERVYALSPEGRLFALRLRDGRELWSQDLKETSEARKPFFGFSTAPLLAGGVLVVQTGGEGGRSITAFDPKTGEPRWAKGDDAVQYQSPLWVELDGKAALVALNDRHLFGLEPADGRVLWQHEHGLEARAAVPTRIGERRLLLNGSREVLALDLVGPKGGPYTLEEAWRSRELARSYALPVLHDGVIYGFTGRFLTALDPATGERLWKSRPPGGRGLALVDGHIAVLDPQGDLVLGSVSREGYVERARVAALKAGSYTAPTYADGRFFVRNLEEIAALSLADAPAMGTTAAIPIEGELASALAGLGEKSPDQAVDRLLRDRPLPWIEDSGLVHFLFRGEAGDVAVEGLGLVEGMSQIALRRVEGTDLWARSVRVDTASRRLYRYVLDYEDTRPDPGNPHRMAVGENVYSELRMPGWRLPDHQRPSEGAGGRLEEITIESAAYEEPRTLQVYLPPSYDQGADFPLLVVLHGDQAREHLGLQGSLDHLLGDRVEPLVAVFVDETEPREYLRQAERCLRFLTDDLLPALEKRYRLASDPARRGLWGRNTGGYLAMYAALEAPGTFRRAAAQGYYAYADKNVELMTRVAGDLPEDLRLYLDWTRWDRSSRAQKLAEALDRAGRDWTGGEGAGTSEWHDLAGRIDRPLQVLFPTTPQKKQAELPSSWDLEEIAKKMPPYDFEGHLYPLAWQIVEDDRPLRLESFLAIKALGERGYTLAHLYRHPNSEAPEWRLSGTHVKGKKGTKYFPGVWFSHVKYFAKRPTNEALYNALSFEEVNWSFELEEGWRLVSGGVCESSWREATGENPTRFFAR